MSAAAFAKGLLDLEGQLTPILVFTFILLRSRGVLQCLMITKFLSSFSRFLWLARTLPCWMDLIMPALKWKRPRFALLFDESSLFCINRVLATLLNHWIVVSKIKTVSERSYYFLKGA